MTAIALPRRSALRNERALQRERAVQQERAVRRPALRVVTAADAGALRVAARRRLVLTVVAVTACLSLFGVAAAHVVIAQSQFQLARLERESSLAQARYDRLRLEVAELESPARIVATAQERLGMVPPPEVTYLTPLASSVSRAVPPARAAAAREAAAASGPTEWSLLKPHLAPR